MRKIVVQHADFTNSTLCMKLAKPAESAEKKLNTSITTSSVKEKTEVLLQTTQQTGEHAMLQERTVVVVAIECQLDGVIPTENEGQ